MKTSELNKTEANNDRLQRGLAPVSLLGDLLAIVPRQLTCGKAFAVCQRGYDLTGFVLRHPDTGEMCIVEQAAVRWIGKDESWNLMHPQSPNVES
jgi:hypothetical protein